MVAALFLSGGILFRPMVVGADEFEVSGTLTSRPEGSVVIDNGSTAYGVVAAMHLTPFLGRTVTLDGAIDHGVLYARDLTVGAIHLNSAAAGVNLRTTGIVEQTEEGFQMTVEGITFALAGSAELGQVVGRTAAIEGQIQGTLVILTSLRTTDGQEITPDGTGTKDVTGESSNDPIADGEWGKQH